MYSRKYIPLVVLFFFLISQTIFAQAEQYRRKKKSAEVVAPAVLPGAPVVEGTDKKAPATASSSTSGDGNQKVDISDLEQRYWAPKDEEFRVVQNRTYSKEKRFALTALFGPIINDSYSDGTAINLGLAYYLTERYGVELQYTKYSLKNNDMVSYFNNQYGVIPDHNKATSYYGAAFNWVPIYAKLSLLEKQIFYFDMSISPGIGLMNYDQQERNGNATKSAVAFSLDVAQHFFINKNFAIRVDLKNRFYNEDVASWNTGATVRTKSTTQTMLLFGFTYYH